MKKTIVINFVGAPGAGKSYMAMRVASNLKERRISCEYVPEFAKDLVYEGREEELGDQLYILAMQNHMLKRVKDKVDVIVTDSPIILSIYYNEASKSLYENEIFNNLILSTFDKYDNYVYFVERNHPYVREGRYQTESESDRAGEKIKASLDESNISYKIIVCGKESADSITDYICSLLSLNNIEKHYEHERKFLLKDTSILKLCEKKVHIVQNYLDIGKSEVRVRNVDNKKYYLTEKEGKGSKRIEKEKEISEEEYLELLKRYSKGKTIEKDRYFIDLKKTKSCEINVFYKPKPLKLIEVEFDSSEDMNSFTPPDFFGEEVTDRKDYYNYNIATKE